MVHIKIGPFWTILGSYLKKVCTELMFVLNNYYENV